jgi:hypothetical protein
MFYRPLPDRPTQERPAANAPKQALAGAVDIQMKNVNFRLAQDIVLEVGTLRGKLRRIRPEVPVTFDDSTSVIVEIDSARVAVTPESLTALLNSYVMAYDDAPINGDPVTGQNIRAFEFGYFLPVGERSRLSFDYQIKNHPSFEDDAINGRFMVTWGILVK